MAGADRTPSTRAMVAAAQPRIIRCDFGRLIPSELLSLASDFSFFSSAFVSFGVSAEANKTLPAGVYGWGGLSFLGLFRAMTTLSANFCKMRPSLSVNAWGAEAK